MFVYKLHLSIPRPSSSPAIRETHPTIKLTRTDNLQYIQASISDLDLSDKTARVYIEKEDGHIIFNDCLIVGNYVLFKVTDQMTAKEGVHPAEITVYNAKGEKLHAPQFYLSVSKELANATAIESTDEFSAFGNALRDIDELRRQLLQGGGGGSDGKSAYEVACDNGFVGTVDEWLISLIGERGEQGEKGDPGAPGKSAYEVACDNGFDGTIEEWLEGLKGEKGDQGDPGSGGSSALQSDLTVSNPIGKYAKDDVITKGTDLETVFRGLLSKTYYPTLTPPSCSLTYSANALYKVGATISTRAASVSFNRGSINPQYTAESGYRSGEATEYRLQLSGATAEYSKSQTTNAFDVPAFTRNTKGSVTLKAEVSYSAGVQPKDSDGDNYQSPLQAGSVTANKTIEFILPFYYGVSDSDDITSFTGLTEDLVKKGNKTYYFNADNQHLVIAYDSSYGNIKSIIDANNFDLINGWTKTTKTIDGQTYNVYVSNKKNTDTNIKATFNF